MFKNRLCLIIPMAFLFGFYSCSELLEDSNTEEDPTEEPKDDTPSKPENKTVAEKFADRLNQIRSNPTKYGESVGVDLSYVKPMPALNWNDVLAKVAQQKAQDMADRNYFSHVSLDGCGVNILMNQAGYKLDPSWYSDPSLNYFESLQAGCSTIDDAIFNLIEDSGSSDVMKKGHRNHLLGITDWNASLYDIGVGYGYSSHSTYKHYWSIIIAKHEY